MKNGRLFKLITYFKSFSQNVTREIIRSAIQAILEKKEFTNLQKPTDSILYLQNELIQELVNLVNEGEDIRDSLKGNKFNCSKQFYQPLFSEEQQLLQSQKIYKLGILSFTLLSGNPPFQEATQSDPFYSFIFENNCYEFWQQHDRKRADQFYSVNYKHFFQSCIFKCLKLSLRDLLNQEWFHILPMNEELLRKQYQEIIEEKQQIKIEKKKQQLEKKKQYEDVQCLQPLRFRDPENQKFLEYYYQYKYNSQSLEETNLQIIEDEPFCLLVDEKLTMAAPAFASFAQTLSIPIQIIHQDALGQGQPYEIKCSSLKALSKSKFQIHLQYAYGTEYEEIFKNLIVVVDLKKCNQNLAFTFYKEKGSIFYFSLFFNLVKERFEYCLAK